MARVIGTVADRNVEPQLKRFMATLRGAGWEGSVLICTPYPCEIEAPDNRCNIVALPPWYRMYWPEPRGQLGSGLHRRYANFLKPLLVDQLQDGDDLLFADSSDVVFFQNPGALFHLLEKAPEAMWAASMQQEPELVSPTIPGFAELFGVSQERLVRVRDGMFMCRVCEPIKRFMQLWKALCGWAISWGYGDMLPWTLALSVWDGYVMELPVDAHWLIGYGCSYDDQGRLLGTSEPISVLHGPGDQRPLFERSVE